MTVVDVDPAECHVASLATESRIAGLVGASRAFESPLSASA